MKASILKLYSLIIYLFYFTGVYSQYITGAEGRANESGKTLKFKPGNDVNLSKYDYRLDSNFNELNKILIHKSFKLRRGYQYSYANCRFEDLGQHFPAVQYPLIFDTCSFYNSESPENGVSIYADKLELGELGSLTIARSQIRSNLYITLTNSKRSITYNPEPIGYLGSPVISIADCIFNKNLSIFIQRHLNSESISLYRDSIRTISMYAVDNEGPLPKIQFVNLDNIRSESLRCLNLIFEKRILIQSSSFKESITFDHCTFERTDNLWGDYSIIIQGDFNNWHSGNLPIHQINFNDCKIKEPSLIYLQDMIPYGVDLSQLESPLTIRLHNCSFENGLKLKEDNRYSQYKGRLRISLTGSEIDRMNFNYDNFDLVFLDYEDDDSKNSVYESLIALQKKLGYVKGYKKAVRDYKDFWYMNEVQNSFFLFKPLIWAFGKTDRVLWDYGNEKSRLLF